MGFQKLLAAFPLILLSIGMASIPIAAGLTTGSQCGVSSQGTVVGTSTININGTTYPLVFCEVPPNPGATAAASSGPYPSTANGGSVSPLTSSSWQFGAQWGPSSTYYGAGLTMDYFDGQSTSTPNFTYWLGLTDNSASCTGGCFYQAGLDWYDNTYLGLCDSYVGFILDSISGLTTPNNCILGTQQWTATQITSGSETIWLFLYNGQWYSAFSGSAESGYAPSGAIGAPGGADSATAVSGRAGAISEGWTNSGYTNYGEDLGSKIQYVTSVSLSGGIFTLSFTDATTSISDYYQASGTGYISPPSTANWYVGGSCPYTYESYFYSGGPGLPSSSSLSAC